MIPLLWAGSAHTRYFLRRYMPTNILLDAIRSPHGLKWGVPAMLLAIPYFFIATVLVKAVEGGGPGWLHLLVLLSIWNGLKMLWIGPTCLILLATAHRSSLKARRDNWRVAEPTHPDTYGPDAAR